MKTIGRKVIPVLISLVMMFGMLPLQPSVLADEQSSDVIANVTSGNETNQENNANIEDFTYQLNSEDTVEITGYTGTATDIAIPEEIDGKVVTGIGESAFAGGDNLVSVTVPQSIEYIGKSAFYQCHKLTSINLVDGLKEIQAMAFDECTNLLSIDIPDTVSEIGVAAFWGCSRLANITLPNGITTIHISVFNGCSSLKEITVPDSVLSIELGAFSECVSLKSIVLPTGVTYISDGLFRGCTSLREVVVSDKTTKIGSHAFENCTSLKTIDLPETLQEFGAGVFYGCKSLEKIIIPKGVTSIPESAFEECRNLSEVTFPDSVTSIGINAFLRCINLTVIQIPDGIKDIGSKAFYDCRGLIKLSIPGSVYKIGSYAFGSCTNLSEIDFSEGLTYLDEGAFHNCTSMTTFDLPDSLVEIGRGAFGSCSALTKIEIPEGVIVLGRQAFFLCDHLREVVIPANVTSIGDEAFRSTTESIKIYGYKGSTAEQYALDNSIKFIELPHEHQLRKVEYHAAECLVEGNIEYWKCDVCENLYSDENAEHEIETADTVLQPLGHRVSHVERIDATCEYSGKAEYWECSTCHKMFDDEEATLVLTEEDVFIPPHGHSLGYCYPVEPTCEEEGVIEYWECTLCDKLFLDMDGNFEVSIENTVLQPTGHRTVKKEQVEPTCEDCGNIEHWECENCRKQYSDKEATKELTAEDIIIPAKGHEPGEAVVENKVDATCETTGHFDEVIYCKVCKEELSREKKTIDPLGHKLTAIERVEPTCTARGNISYWKCETCGKLFSDEAAETEIGVLDTILAAVGHKLGDDVIENKVDATCEMAGHFDEVIYCSVCKEELRRVQKTIDPLGHKLLKTEQVESTCTEPGNTDYWTCKVCEKLFSDEAGTTEIELKDTVLPARGHEPGEAVVENKVDATCETAGHFDEVAYCTVCKEELNREKKTIDPLGHDWGDWIIDREATMSETGLKHRECNNDPEHIEEEVIPVRENHEWKDPAVNKEFTGIAEEKDGTVFYLVDGEPELNTSKIVEYNGKKYYVINGVVDAARTEIVQNDSLPFGDVKSDTWFYYPVLYVYGYRNANGTAIMSGYSDGKTFGAVDPLTRGQFAVMLYRIENEPETVFDPKTFPDVTAGNFYSEAAVWASSNGFITGYQNGNFGPTDLITREQLATILYRYAVKKGYNTTVQGDLSRFSDTQSISPFAINALIWANGAGIITGTADNRINPQGKKASRAECAAMIQRFITFTEK